MYDRFSDMGQVTLKAARRITRASGQEVMNTDSLLLGLTEAGDQSVAARILKDVGLWGRLTARVNALGVLPSGFYGQALLKDDQAKEALQEAYRYAQELDHHYVGTEHILLGLIGRCPLLHEECRRHNIETGELRKRVYRLLGMDANTDDDYANLRSDIMGMLAEFDEDRQVVRKIFRYLKDRLPNHV